MLLRVTKEELQKNRNLDPGWYEGIYKGVEMSPAAPKPGKPSSTNYVANFEITKDGRVLSFQWNSQLMQMAEKFMCVISDTVIQIDPNDKKKVTADVDFDTEANIGKKIQVHVFDDPFQGRMLSKIDDFAPLGKDMTAPF